jgi:endoglucanase
VSALKVLKACAAGLLSIGAASPDAPSPIRLNQLGLLPDAPVHAIFSNSSNRPLRWTLRDSAGATLEQGQTRVFGNDPLSGEHVHRIDVSRVPEGNGYVLAAANVSSRRFSVRSSTYDRLPYDALAFFYHARAGIPIEARFVGEQWARPAGHPVERAPCLSGLDRNRNRWPGCSYSLDVSGGWYDAGDHGKYLVNGGIALWTLQNVYEVEQSSKAPPLFADRSARMPEAGNSISDLLDESRWEMEFFLRMQAPEGSHQQLPVGEKRNRAGMAFLEVDTSGMAHHKVADRKWTRLPLRPDQDPEDRLLFPPSTGATLNLAATAAQCARIWRAIDPVFSGRCLASARRAWDAAARNPEVYAIADFDGSGAYGDLDLSDEFYWAAAELFVTTGEAKYRGMIEASPHFRKRTAAPPSWASVGPLGTIVLAQNPDALGKAEADRMRQRIVTAADAFLSDRERTGYGVPMASHWNWGSTSGLLNRAMLLALASDWTGDPRYRNGVIDVMDFILGRNPLDRSFVSGYGARPMQNPHHRFWAHSLDPAFPPPPPGALSGGPNNQAMSDEVAAKMRGKCAPQTCWADDIRAFSLNEVAINWNAPLVWVSAWLAGPRTGK